MLLSSTLLLLILLYRYGVASIGYPEQHIQNVKFAGFSLSKCLSQKSAAIAINPEQIDQQPAILVSKVQWNNVDTLSRLGFRNSAQVATACGDKPCSGTNLIKIHDFDGSVTSGISGGGSSCSGGSSSSSRSRMCRSSRKCSSSRTSSNSTRKQ